MKTLDDTIYLQRLYDFYGKLLTNKQQSYFEAYYFNDYSITEIAENHHISRNAVFDQLKRVETKLEEYETQLSLYQNYQKRQSIYREIGELEEITTIKELIDKVKEIE
ncbi:MAG: sigma factor-like helix-turn-helix DNA-binding protein [Candidatus Izemoplasma sp.]|nr:sigma factor-like helix-turn-helix DNA-binding protein [Candidatus Izemoplasma sp.]